MALRKKLHLVQRLAWCPLPNDDFRRGRCEQHPSVEGFPVRAFETKARATKYAKHLTMEARRELNPFQFSYHHVTELMDAGEEDLLSAIAELGLPSPIPQHRCGWNSELIDWPAWHDDLADTLADDEREAIWNLLNRIELYRVVEVEFL